MFLRALPGFAMMAIAGLGVQAEAQAPCREFLRLRNTANEAWREAMRATQPERCGALHHAASAMEATSNYAADNRQSCNISAQLLNQVKKYHREAIEARDNVCAGRPVRPYPPDIIQR